METEYFITDFISTHPAADIIKLRENLATVSVGCFSKNKSLFRGF